MAVINSVYMRGAKQKLGGVVFYQQKGRTLARELAPQVSNPRTSVQMNQRIKLANVVAMYRANKAWMKGAFENKPANESDYNAFVKANLTLSEVTQSKAEASANACVVAPYVVTQGSLLAIEHTPNLGEIWTNLYLGNFQLGDGTTVGELSTALITNNSGVEEGMQLSLIVNIQKVNASTGIPYVIMRAYEMIIQKNSLALVTNYFAPGLVVDDGEENASLGFDGSSLGAGAACFILSKTAGGKTSVSPQSLVPFGTNEVYAQYTRPGKAAEDATSYGDSTAEFLDSLEANPGTGTMLSNLIESARIGGQRYLPGSIVQGPLALNTVILLFFERPLAVDDNLTTVVQNRNTTTTVQHLQDWDETSPNVVEITLSEQISVEVQTPFRITVNVGDEVAYFDFSISSGDIS